MNLFPDPLDTEGTVYFIRSCDNEYIGISHLSSGYRSTTGIISRTSSGLDGGRSSFGDGEARLLDSGSSGTMNEPEDVVQGVLIKGTQEELARGDTRPTSSSHGFTAVSLAIAKRSAYVIARPLRKTVKYMT